MVGRMDIEVDEETSGLSPALTKDESRCFGLHHRRNKAAGISC